METVHNCNINAIQINEIRKLYFRFIQDVNASIMGLFKELEYYTWTFENFHYDSSIVKKEIISLCLQIWKSRNISEKYNINNDNLELFICLVEKSMKKEIYDEIDTKNDGMALLEKIVETFENMEAIKHLKNRMK
jgi:hypothetical protein